MAGYFYLYLARRRHENFQVLQCKIIKYITLVRSRRETFEDRNCDDVETVTKIASLKIRFLGNLILAPKKL